MKTDDTKPETGSHSMRVPAIIFIIVALVVLGIWFAVKNSKHHDEPVIIPAQKTELTLVNNTKDSLLVFLTLSGYPVADSATYVQNVNGIFGCTQTGLVGSFYINPKDSVSYTSAKWFSGNVSFGAQPLNCFTTAWPTGVNPFEFNINNGQESIDISAMGGVNCLLQVDLVGGPQWQASPSYPNVRYFYNDSMWKNSELIGVYPYGCTNCTNTQGKQTCQTPNEQPNSKPICTPTRSAGVHGGLIRVTFLGYTNFQICK
jgi:hypothetical protein